LAAKSKCPDAVLKLIHTSKNQKSHSIKNCPFVHESYFDLMHTVCNQPLDVLYFLDMANKEGMTLCYHRF